MRRVSVDTLPRRPRASGEDFLLAFKQRLRELGWDEGRNIRFDYRSGSDARSHAGRL
jgi:hypothetical protein